MLDVNRVWSCKSIPAFLHPWHKRWILGYLTMMYRFQMLFSAYKNDVITFSETGKVLASDLFRYYTGFDPVSTISDPLQIRTSYHPNTYQHYLFSRRLFYSMFSESRKFSRGQTPGNRVHKKLMVSHRAQYSQRPAIGPIISQLNRLHILTYMSQSCNVRRGLQSGIFPLDFSD